MVVSYAAEVSRPKVLSAQPLPHLEDRYLLAAGLIVASIIAYALIGDHEVGALVVVVVQSATLMVILHASQVSSRAMALAAGFVAVAIVLAGLSVVFDRESIGPGVAGAMLAVVGPPVIIKRLLAHQRIDLATVAGSLCVYLLAGMFFAYVYRVIDVIDTPFFVQKAVASPVDFIYFSFVTMTTLGYGDLTSRANLGRMLSVSEALFGQLYLVSVVAVLVANIGHERIRDQLKDNVESEDEG